MPLPSSLLVLCALVTFSTAAQTPTTSKKRGLCFTPNPSYPQDNSIWTQSPSDLTWYYNYGADPSPAYSSLSQEKFEFVPMLWGAPKDTSDTSFLEDVKELIEKRGNITHVMSFNEPDGTTDTGGSNVDPETAAKVWVNNFIPLQKLGVKVGLPACTGGWGGVPWLTQMLGNCSKIISGTGSKKNCTYDFVPIHWYGNFEGLASHIGTYSAAFPNTSIWITEYNLDHQDLPVTQSFYNTSAEYLDRLDVIERYSIFAAFRSSKSNVGPNGAMLNSAGQLTDIGAWYLGRSATGVKPDNTSAATQLLPSGLAYCILVAVSIVFSAFSI